MSKRTTARVGYSPEAALVTDIVLETFRLNGRLTFVGDRMTKPLGLSTARWQAIGAVSLAQRPLTVPQIARAMGLQRQSVQRTINVLVDDGLVETVDNPDHQRARLVVLTDKGKTAFEKAIGLQMKWAEGLSAGLSSSELETALSALRMLRTRLESHKSSRAPQKSSARSRVGERPKRAPTRSSAT